MLPKFHILKEPYPRIIGVPLVGILLTFVLGKDPYSFSEFFKSISIVGIMWNADFYLLQFYRKRYPKLNQTPKRLFRSGMGLLAANTVLDFLLCQWFDLLGIGDQILMRDYYPDKLIINFTVTVIIAMTYESGYFFSGWKAQLMLNEQIQSRQLQSELSALKNQISPHFLFNSLNTLITLIQESPEKATAFTEKLSDVYRYILQFKESEVVDLNTELAFAEAYGFLMKMRFEEGLELDIQIPQNERHKGIAPLSLQLLIENAIKHNVVSKSKPLKLEVYTENGISLIVKNNLQPKRSSAASTGTGLKNIKSRYALLSQHEVDIIETPLHFMVALPLLPIKSMHQTIL